MTRSAAALFVLALAWPPAARAADLPVQLTLDGRPISRKVDVALMRDGVLFVNAVDLTRVFNGLLIFHGPSGVEITVRSHKAQFAAGSRQAHIDGSAVTLPAAPFLHNGDLYVPISTILGPRTGITMEKLGPQEADLHVKVFASATPAGAKAGRATPALALAIAPAAMAASDGLHVSVKVRNTLSRPFVLTFPSSARADFTVDRDGSSVWDSVTGKRFIQTLSNVTLAPGETVTYSDVWTAWNQQPAGRYQLRVRLMLSPPLISSPVSLGVVTPGSH